jgi:DNA-binding transcriptional ArsR family regulator
MAEAGGERRKDRRDQEKGEPRKRKKARKGGEPRPRREPNGRRRSSLIAAIDNPLRRRILRTIGGAGKPLSPVQISRMFRVPLATVGYHTRVLLACGAVEPAGERPVRGAVEHFYDTTIENDPPIEALLEETRAVDEEDG